MYDTLRLAQWRKDGHLWRAVCLECQPERRAYHNRELDMCNLCNEQKPFGAFFTNRQKSRDLKAWRCMLCERPVRTFRQARPEKPIMYQYDRDGYKCLGCRYPPCAGGCGRPRPERAARWSVERMPEWRCRQCRL